jgi:hypothetical protein
VLKDDIEIGERCGQTRAESLDERFFLCPSLEEGSDPLVGRQRLEEEHLSGREGMLEHPFLQDFRPDSLDIDSQSAVAPNGNKRYIPAVRQAELEAEWILFFDKERFAVRIVTKTYLLWCEPKIAPEDIPQRAVRHHETRPGARNAQFARTAVLRLRKVCTEARHYR